MAPTIVVLASEHPVKSVTIFESHKAEVVRTFQLDLKTGQNKVEIQRLSGTIDTESVRVSGLGNARLFDVVCTTGGDKTTSYAPTSPSEIIRVLKANKLQLEGEKRVREQEADLLLNYAKTLNGEHVTPEKMSHFLESFVEHGRKNLESVASLTEKIVDIERKIERETDTTLQKTNAARGGVTVIIASDQDRTVELKLTYIVSHVGWKPIYELHATTEDGKPSSSVSLHFHARIAQTTGEDWSNAALTLSTASANMSDKRVPRLHAVRICPRPSGQTGLFTNPQTGFGSFGQSSTLPSTAVNSSSTFYQPRLTPGSGIFGDSSVAQQQSAFHRANQLAQQQLTTGLFGQAANHGQQQQQPPAGGLFGAPQPQPEPRPQFGNGVGGGGLFGRSIGAHPQVEGVPVPQTAAEDGHDFDEIPPPDPVSELSTVVTGTPLAVSYSVHGEPTIPCDGVEHQVSVAVLPFEAVLTYVSVPRIEPRVYLQCEVKNTSEYRLLAGPVNVILDDSHISRTSIQKINKGDTFDCTLGDDTSVKVTYSRTSRTQRDTGGAFSEITDTTTNVVKISVHNKHQYDIPNLIVRDVIPTSDDKRMRVILRKPEGLADAKDGEEIDLKDGLKVSWEKSGGEKTGKFEWKGKVESNAKVSMESRWEVKSPANLH